MELIIIGLAGGSLLTLFVLVIFAHLYPFPSEVSLLTGVTYQSVASSRELALERYRRTFKYLQAVRGGVPYDNADELLEDIIKVYRAFNI